jgi:iron complex outermembrane receptor protein
LEHTLLYATISRGVKSGGFTTHNTTNGAMANPFATEKLLAYEIGVKSDITPTLRVNASVFHYDYTDQQILSKALDTVSNSYIGVFVNVPKSRIDGGEVEVTWLPVEGLAINQYAGYKTGKYTSTILNGDTPPKNFDGQDLSFPKLNYGGNISYAIPLGTLQLTPEFNYSYHDSYSQLFLLGPDYTVPSYWLANANLTLSPADSIPGTISPGTSSFRVALWPRPGSRRPSV